MFCHKLLFKELLTVTRIELLIIRHPRKRHIKYYHTHSAGYITLFVYRILMNLLVYEVKLRLETEVREQEILRFQCEK